MVWVHTTVPTLTCVDVFAVVVFVEVAVVDVVGARLAVVVAVVVSGAFLAFAVVAIVACSALRVEVRVRLVVFYGLCIEYS